MPKKKAFHMGEKYNEKMKKRKRLSLEETLLNINTKIWQAVICN